MATFYGTPNNEQLVGTTSDDLLLGLDGNDQLEGAAGNDVLLGGFGNDTYIFRPGSGKDIIDERGAGGSDTLQLTGGIIAANVLLFRESNDLVIRFTNSQDQITVAGYYDPATPGARIERIVFDDFTVWDPVAIDARVYSFNSNATTAGNDTLTGTIGNDTIYGLDGNDTISAAQGSDALFGGNGNDTLFGNAGGDALYGEAGNDTLRGGGGNDMLQGGTGNDTYVLALGHGVDQIVDTGGVDTVYIDSNYDPAAVLLHQSGSDLIIRSILNGDMATVIGHFDPMTPERRIESIAFSDGTIWDANAIQTRVSNYSSNYTSPMDDVILGTLGNDFVSGWDGNDTVSGGQGDDQVMGDLGNDRLFGNQGNDILDGGVGDDVLAGNLGDDSLNGGMGDDTYFFSLGDGHDVISDLSSSGQGNRIVFGEGIAITDLALRQDGADLIIEVAGTSDTLRLLNTVMPGMAGPRAVDTLQFADGLVVSMADNSTALILGTSGSDMIYGTAGKDAIYALAGDDTAYAFEGNDRIDGGAGNDFIDAGMGNDTIIGGTGNDTLNGGGGSDTYVFNAGDGEDTIYELPVMGESNNVVFGNGIGFQDLHANYDIYTGGTVIDVGTQGDRLHINYGSPDPYSFHTINSFTFADGTTASFDAVAGYAIYWQGGLGGEYNNGTNYADSLYGNGGDDVLYGNGGDDILSGSAGYDMLSGGQGNDTYVFNLGDGIDSIEEMAMPDETNTVQFGAGITLEDLRLRFDGWTPPRLEIGSNGDAILFPTFYPMDPMLPVPVTNFRFADGSTITMSELVDRGFYIGGSESSWDYLVGSQYNDRIYGYGGSDTLYGVDGNDTLIGGTGDDTLDGGAGNDTYVFAAGDGFDRIIEGSPLSPYGWTGGGTDTVRLTTGYDPATTMLSQVYNSLVIRNAMTGDEILVSDHFGNAADPNSTTTVNRIVFDDGTIWNEADINNRIASFNNNMPTEGNDTIAGMPWGDYLLGMTGDDTISGGGGDDILRGEDGNDRLFGGDGNDSVLGENGNDTLAGGKGDDTLDGGLGGDTYLFNLGDGVDTVNDYFGPNRVVFGEGIHFQDLHGSFDPLLGAYVLDVGNNGDRLIAGTAGPATVETFQFADGTVATLDALFGYGVYRQGTQFGEWMYGTGYADSLYGNGGDDNLFADSGNDYLAGGKGSDILDGGAGSDTYYYNRGDGLDTINDYSSPFEGNRLVFGEGIKLSDLAFRTDGINAWIEVLPLAGSVSPVSPDIVQLQNFYPYDPFMSGSISRFEFSDGTLLTDKELVAALNQAPVISMLVPDQIAAEDFVFSYQVPAGLFTDPNGEPVQYSATLADGSPLPSWLSYNSYVQAFVGTPGNEDVGNLTVRLTAVDRLGASASVDFNLSVMNTNDAPVVSMALANQTATEDAAFSFAIPAGTFSDVDAGDAMTYSATLADGSALPSWLVFDAATQTFSGTPANGDVGSLSVRVVATDTTGASASSDFALSVVNVNDAPVVSMALANQTATEDAAFSFTLPAGTFSDVDAGDALTYSATLSDGSALPSWLVFDAATQTFSGTPVNGDVGNLSVRVVATDTTGASASSDFVLAVLNTNDAPTLANAIPDQNGSEGQAFSYTVPAGTFSDVDAGDTLTYTATLADGSALPAWLIFDAATMTFSGTPQDRNAGSYAIRLQATDSAGASIFDDFVVNVADTLATVVNGTSGANSLNGTAFRDTLNGLGGNDTLYGYAGDDWLDGGSGADRMIGGTGNDTYVVSSSDDRVTENTNEGIDTVRTSISYTLGANVENLALTGSGNVSGTGNSLNNVIIGNSASNTLTGNGGNDTLQGLGGNDKLRGGTGNDTYVFGRGDGADTISENDSTAGNTDTASLGVNALDVVFTKSSSNLVMSLHGGSETLTVSNWYSGSQYQTEIIQSADGLTLTNTQVNQLVQAMASFTATTGLTWDQAIDQRPQDVAAIISAYWQAA